MNDGPHLRGYDVVGARAAGRPPGQWPVPVEARAIVGDDHFSGF